MFFEDEVNLCNILINYLKKFNMVFDEIVEEIEFFLRVFGWFFIKGK